MKRISLLLAGMGLVVTASATYATTSLSSNWICTTNASSSDVASDKAADKQLADTAQSASDAFSLALKNCRDCTKITCGVQNQ